MAVQPLNLTLFEDKSLPFKSAVFLSMTIDPASRRRSHKFTPQDLIPALKPLSPPQVAVQAQVRARIPTTDDGEMFLYLYRNTSDTKEHLAIVYGDDIRSLSLDASRPGETDTDRIVRGAYVGRLSLGSLPSTTTPYLPQPAEAPLVRIHSECFTGETVHSARCDCGEQLDEAMRRMKEAGRGVVVYLRQEGRGIGLLEKLKAYNLQDLGNDTVAANLLLHHPADARKYDVATAILRDLGLTEIKLLTNNPDKIEQVEGEGVKVVERVPMVPKKWEGGKLEGGERELDKYLRTKVERMRHIIDVPTSPN